MQLIDSLEQARSLVKASVVTLGNFDGVHRGHVELLQKLKAKAKSYHCPSVVVTFEPHPMQVLHPEREFQRIFPWSDQVEQMKRWGVDYFVRHPFTLEFSKLKPKEFLVDVLFKDLHPRALVVGYDFAFGSDRQGTLKSLQDVCAENAVEVEIIPPFEKDGLIVSSSKIREFIRRGEISRAEDFLDRPFYLKGKVISGDRRGRTIGFPTANLEVSWSLKPRVGVYLTQMKIKEAIYPAMTNVGWNPTVSDLQDRIKIESHILGFNQEIYGQDVVLTFVKFLREEKKFSSLQELKSQLEVDLQQAKDFFHVRS